MFSLKRVESHMLYHPFYFLLLLTVSFNLSSYPAMCISFFNCLLFLRNYRLVKTEKKCSSYHTQYEREPRATHCSTTHIRGGSRFLPKGIRALFREEEKKDDKTEKGECYHRNYLKVSFGQKITRSTIIFRVIKVYYIHFVLKHQHQTKKCDHATPMPCNLNFSSSWSFSNISLCFVSSAEF